MSSTNKTPNYNLPQYVADDKPTYLEDFNQAMMNIDTAIKETDVKAESNIADVQNALETANQAIENANQANETALHAQNDATNAIATSNNAQTVVNNMQTTVNQNSQEINEMDDWIIGTLEKGENYATNSYNLSYKFNKKLNLLSFYGLVNGGENPIPANTKIAKLPDFLKPLNPQTIYNCGYFYYHNAQNTVPSDLTFTKDGFIKLSTDNARILLISSFICTKGWFKT